jgi:CRISPR-associated Csx14 family protein
MHPGKKNASAVLIATLGTEAQVVTAALDLLLEQSESIDDVSVVHTVAPGTDISRAVNRLREAFAIPPYIDQIHLNLVPLIDKEDQPLADIETPQAARVAFRALYKHVLDAKRSQKRVHLSIAGGRKSLAVYGMTTAQLLFDEGDRLWHLYSGGDFLESKRLHPEPGDRVHLIDIPVILWGQVSPVLTDLNEIEDPFEAVERVRQLRLGEKLEQARSFVLGSLTAAERRVVDLLVREGLSDIEIAERLVLSPRTVEGQLRSAYRKAADHWALEEVKRAGMIALLNLYYNLEFRGNYA